MKEKVNKEQRAFLVWPILTNCARKNEPITYGELGIRLGIFHRTFTPSLSLIQEFCIDNELPPLTILVITKKKGLPGNGFKADNFENLQDEINKVYTFNWSSLPNPFENQYIVTAERQL
jgi:putative restriction endonuclease